MGVNKFGWVFLIASILLVGFLLKPFMTAIAFGAVTAFLWHPVHFRLRSKISENWSATILTVITALIAVFLIVIGAKLVLSEFGNIYLYFSKLNIPNLLSATPEIGTAINDVTRFLLSKIIAGLSAFASKLPHIMLSMLIFFITLFFFLKDGERLVKWAKKNVPLNAQKKEQIYKDLNNYAHAFINVWLLIGILQFIVAIVGFYIFGLPYALVAGMLAAALSVIPIIGPYALYIPVGIFLVLKGNITCGIGILAYGITFGSILDYGLRPYLASKWACVHPIIILLGIFCGIAALGPAGFIIGQMLLMIVATLFKDFCLIKELT